MNLLLPAVGALCFATCLATTLEGITPTEPLHTAELVSAVHQVSSAGHLLEATPQVTEEVALNAGTTETTSTQRDLFSEGRGQTSGQESTKEVSPGIAPAVTEALKEPSTGGSVSPSTDLKTTTTAREHTTTEGTQKTTTPSSETTLLTTQPSRTSAQEKTTVRSTTAPTTTIRPTTKKPSMKPSGYSEANVPTGQGEKSKASTIQTSIFILIVSILIIVV